MIKVGQLYATNQNDSEKEYFTYLLITKVNKRFIHFYLWDNEGLDQTEYVFLYQEYLILEDFTLIDEI